MPFRPSGLGGRKMTKVLRGGGSGFAAVFASRGPAGGLQQAGVPSPRLTRPAPEATEAAPWASTHSPPPQTAKEPSTSNRCRCSPRKAVGAVCKALGSACGRPCQSLTTRSPRRIEARRRAAGHGPASGATKLPAAMAAAAAAAGEPAMPGEAGRSGQPLRGSSGQPSPTGCSNRGSGTAREQHVSSSEAA